MTRIDGTVDSPPCLKVTHKTFGSQNSNADMVFCRLSMPVEFHSVFKAGPVVDMNGVHEEDSLKVKHRCGKKIKAGSDSKRHSCSLADPLPLSSLRPFKFPVG